MNPLPNDEPKPKSDTPITDCNIYAVVFKQTPDPEEPLLPITTQTELVKASVARRLERELAAAEKRLLEAERDAARYRYLREKRKSDDFVGLPSGWLHVACGRRGFGEVLTEGECDAFVDDGIAHKAASEPLGPQAP